MVISSHYSHYAELIQYEEQTKAICGGDQAELFSFSINLKTEAKHTRGFAESPNLLFCACL